MKANTTNTNTAKVLRVVPVFDYACEPIKTVTATKIFVCNHLFLNRYIVCFNTLAIRIIWPFTPALRKTQATLYFVLFHRQGQHKPLFLLSLSLRKSDFISMVLSKCPIIVFLITHLSDLYGLYKSKHIYIGNTWSLLSQSF